MYSLYRAWLSLGGGPTAPNLEPTPSMIIQRQQQQQQQSHQLLLTRPVTPPVITPPTGATTLSHPQPLCPAQPDVTLHVGATMASFTAHRTILVTHSGFFKAALATHINGAPVPVPNVNVDEFSALLTFMYTGYLDLNLNNIYNILLATHILHMPRALEICRTYLIHSQAAAAAAAVAATTIPQLTTAPALPSNIPTAMDITPQQVTTTTTNQPAIIKPIPSRKSTVNTNHYTPIYSQLVKSDSTPFKVVGQVTGLDSSSSSCQASTSVSKVTTITAAGSSKLRRRETTTTTMTTAQTTSSNVVSHNHNNNNNNKVIIDIACCDGPVRFHRVVNKNYGQTTTGSTTSTSSSAKNSRLDVLNLNKVMQENIRDKQLTDENLAKHNELFTCVYCNHTFKSQYCYQKHARRHLNPVTTVVDKDAQAPQKAELPQTQNRREVRLLDMNVQYYPCKTCGSKFPSYYFVHKHRKQCHADEMADNENKNNEMVKVDGGCKVQREEDERTSGSGSGRTSVIIDVESDGNVVVGVGVVAQSVVEGDTV